MDLNLVNKRRVLYFIASYMPTVEEHEHAKAIGATAFRNASRDDGSVEPCDGVAGLVPSQYHNPETVAKGIAPIVEGADTSAAPLKEKNKKEELKK